MEGDETERAEGVKLSNKVTIEIEKYKGKIETFQHEYRSTLKFAITKRQDNSSNSSQNSSRNNSIDRRYSRIHDHLKPNKVGWEDSLEVVLKFQILDMYNRGDQSERIRQGVCMEVSNGPA